MSRCPGPTTPPPSSRGAYLALTLAASTVDTPFPEAADGDAGDVEAALLALAGVEEGQLGRLEVVWSPDAEDEALLRYPTLVPL